jgi:hypothetical protein
MTRFAQGTDPAYIKKVNEAMYGAGKEDAEIKENLLLEAEQLDQGMVDPNLTDTGDISGDTNGDTNGTTTNGGTTKTAGLGDNKMIIYLVVGGVLLWYLNKEGYLKKILK